MGVKAHIGRGFNLHWPWHDALSFIADPLSPPLYTAETLHMTGSCHMQPEPLTNIQINKWYDHRRSSLKNHQCQHKQSITFLKISCHIFFRRRRDCFFFFGGLFSTAWTECTHTTAARPGRSAGSHCRVYSRSNSIYCKLYYNDVCSAYINYMVLQYCILPDVILIIYIIQYIYIYICTSYIYICIHIIYNYIFFYYIFYIYIGHISWPLTYHSWEEVWFGTLQAPRKLLCLIWTKVVK